MLAEDLLNATNPARRIQDRVVGDSARDDAAVLTIRVTPLEIERDSRRWSFDARQQATAAVARAEFREFLRSRSASSEQLSRAELIYAELLGNVVRYTPGPVEIRVDWNRGIPVLHMFDLSPGFQFVPRLPPDMYSEGGRGLYCAES
jgi:anti-sigma regulatory factor (Ser/Thr protein kinase)